MKIRKKRILSTILTLFILCITIVGVGEPRSKNTVYATPSIWDGNTASYFAGGVGTENDPYQIATAEQLALLASVINGGIDVDLTDDSIDNKVAYTTLQKAYYKLIANIVLNDTTEWQDWATKPPVRIWTTIGSENNAFMGEFDGSGYTVSGIYINNSDYYQGLFGYAADSTIKNVGVTNSYVKGYEEVGGVVGQTFGKITNCYNTGKIVSTNNVAGGIAGSTFSNAVIKDCYNTGSISGNRLIGGIVGYPQGRVINCYNTGSISGINLVGGIVGTTSSNIWNCYNTGLVEGTDEVGGIAGSSGVGIRNCYNTGSISGNHFIGGITGKFFSSSKMSSCYNVGSVSGSSNVGSITGYLDVQFSSIVNCYYLEQCAIDGDNVIQFGLGNETIGQTTADVAGITVPFSVGGEAFDHDLDEGDTTPNITLLEALNAAATIYNNTNPPIQAKLWVVNSGINDGYPFIMNTTEFTTAWINNLPNDIQTSNIASIKFLTSKEGLVDYSLNPAKFNGIDIWYKEKTVDSTKTYDLAYVFDGEIVVAADCSNMFSNCSECNLFDFTNFDTSKVTNMSGMFTNCNKLIVLDLSYFDATKLTSASNMLDNCNLLSSVTAPYNVSESTTIDLPQEIFIKESDNTTYTTINNINCSTMSSENVITKQTFNRKYTITLNENDGSYNSYTEPTSYIYGTEIILPVGTQITKTDYVFVGWTTSNSAYDEITNPCVTSISPTDVGDKTFYAKWGLVPPVISVASGYVGEYDGANHNIFVTASHEKYATNLLTYQWYKGGTETSNKIDGATNSSFNVTNVVDSGDYYCIVTITIGDASGLVISSKLTVAINKQKVTQPTANNTIFIADGNAKTYDLVTDNRYQIGENVQTEAGNYTVIVTLKDANNYAWTDGTSDPLTFNFVIRKNQIIEKVEIEGSERSVVVTSENGFNPETEIVVLKVKKDRDDYSEDIKKNEKVIAVYDVKMLVNETEIQPDGTIVIRFPIPSECVNQEFRILHLHGDETTEMTYTIDGDYILVSTNKLSEFIFVTDNTGSLLWLIIVLMVILAAEIALIVLKIVKKKKNNQVIVSSVLPFFLAAYIPVGQIVVIIILGVLCLAGGAYAVYLYFIKDKKNLNESITNTISEETDIIEEANDKEEYK